MKNRVKRFLLLVLVSGVLLFFYFALRANPLAVDSFTVIEGPMEVAVEADGVIRVQDIYTISSPIAGHLDRSVLREGQPVEAGQTIVASIHPLDPPFLDQRTEAELSAEIDAARSGVVLARAELESARAAGTLATSEYKRALRLSESSLIAESAMDRALKEKQLAEAQIARANAEIRLRESTLKSAQAKLIQPGDIRPFDQDVGCCIHLTSPVDGVVLKIVTRSEQAVSPGSVIAEIGNVNELEVVVDLLSADATRIQEGTKASIMEWGGDSPFDATVARIEPSAFTKVSALGIEEQRVWVVLDVDNPPRRLGHNFRVVVRIPIWSTASTLQVPIGSLFRRNKEWSVFVVTGGRVTIRPIEIDHMNDTNAQVIKGLKAGEKVVVYPGDLLEDGSKVTIRKALQ